MSYSCRVYDSMDEVDRDAWDAVRASSNDLFTDPRFISAIATSMAEDTRCWPVLVEDESGQPKAVTCFSLHRVDGALLTGTWLKREVEWMRRIWDGYLRFLILFCGLPVSDGQRTLCVAPDADREQVCEAIDAAIGEKARQLRVGLIVWKEFGPGDCRWLAPLKERGYLQADSLPMSHFEPRFASFEEYLASRNSKARYNIRRSTRKLHEAGLRVVRMRGDDGFDRLYTDEVHKLYEAVVEHSDSRLERLPAEFFREIARRFGKDAQFTVIYKGERIVAFSCNLADKQQFHMLFMGIDYALNRKYDLYFNVLYDGLDCALRARVADICVGQNSPFFKARLGCYQQPRAFFIKGRGLLRLPLRAFARLLFPPMEVLPPPQAFPGAGDPKPSSASCPPAEKQPKDSSCRKEMP